MKSALQGFSSHVRCQQNQSTSRRRSESDRRLFCFDFVPQSLKPFGSSRYNHTPYSWRRSLLCAREVFERSCAIEYGNNNSESPPNRARLRLGAASNAQLVLSGLIPRLPLQCACVHAAWRGHLPFQCLRCAPRLPFQCLHMNTPCDGTTSTFPFSACFAHLRGNCHCQHTARCETPPL